MNNTQLEQLEVTFKSLHQEAAVAYKAVYDGILQQLESTDSRGLGGEISQLEAKKLNQEIMQLTYSVKQAAIKEMLNCGVKDYLTQAGWTEIQQVVGLPKTEICKIQMEAMCSNDKTHPADANNVTSNKSKEYEELIHRYGVAEKVFAGTLGLGSAAVVVSLFIPGWSIPVKILCIAGAAVAIFSGGGVVYCDSKRRDSVSKFENIGKKDTSNAQEGMQINNLVEQITDSQCKRNFALYQEWLMAIKDALIAECDKLSVM